MTIGQGNGPDREPLVTVVLPTFNRAEMVVQAAESIIGQTYPHWELFVVDDGSTDDTVERLDALAEPRLKVIELVHSGIISRPRNIGAAAGTGEFLAFLDSDDVWLPQRLEIQLQALRGSERAWCYADVGLVGRDGAPIPFRGGRARPVSGRIARQLLLDQTGAHIITWLVPRPLFEDSGGFDETLLSHGDLDLAIRLAEIADAIAVPDVLAIVRDHGGRMTRARADPDERAAIVFKKALERSRDPALAKIARRRWTDHLARAGANMLAEGDVARAGTLLWRSLIHGAEIAPWLHSLGSGLRRLSRRRT